VSAHTPGPWIVKQDVYRSGDIDVFARKVQYVGTHVAHVCVRKEPDDGDLPREQALANARLIAAAPDMLALLRDLEWSRLNDGRGVTQVQCPACFALQSRGTGHNPYCGLVAVLAKAEGRK
jgi:hypothetical protein